MNCAQYLHCMFRYALVVAGPPERLHAVRHGSLVCVRPSAHAFYRGSPAPELVDAGDAESTLLGVAVNSVLFAGENSGLTLAVVSLTVSGAADLNQAAIAAMRGTPAGWSMWRNRKVLLMEGERQLVLR